MNLEGVYVMEIRKGKIILYPTRTIIEGYYERNAKLESPLNVWNKVTHSYDFQAYIKDEETNRIVLPTTYSLKYLMNQYPDYEVEDRRPFCEMYFDTMRNKRIINMKYDYRDDIQRGAVKFLNEKTRSKYKYMQRYLCLRTGEGKTYCAVRYIASNGERPIIFVDQDALGKQWRERIKEYTDTTEEEIYYISGKASIDRLMKMTDEEIFNIKFFICCYRTVTNNLKVNQGSKELDELFNKLKLTLKIYDEAHIEYRSIFSMDMITNLRAIYLSATPKRSEANEDKVYQNMFQNVEKFFSYHVTGEVDDNYHNIVMYNWDSKPRYVDQANCATQYGFSMAKYCQYLMQDEVYDKFEEFLYKVLFEFVLKNRKKKKVALLFGTNALLDKFYDNLVKYCSDNQFKLTIGKFNSSINKEERLKQLESDIIITTDKSFSKGMDVKGIQVLINTVPFSSDTKLIQTIGRLRPLPNKEVIFFDINDLGFEAIRNQSRNKKNKVYTKIAKNLFIKEYKQEGVT